MGQIIVVLACYVVLARVISAHHAQRPLAPIIEDQIVLPKDALDTLADEFGHGDATFSGDFLQSVCLFFSQLDLCSNHL